jgi:hypothetical protein
MSQTGSGSSGRTAPRSNKQAQRVGRLNRSQLRAMEIRAAETVSEVDVPVIAPLDPTAPPVPGAAVRRAVATSKRTIARPVALSKAQEFRFIREDLQRLLITAAALFVIMIVLLFVVD